MHTNYADVNALLNKIKNGSHWRVRFVPSEYSEKRIDSAHQVREFVQKHEVMLRGWNYPHLDTKGQQRLAKAYLESWTSFMRHEEYWRLYMSGQFIHLFSVREDEPGWAEQLRIYGPGGTSYGGFLSIHNVVFMFAEIHEFMARLSSEGIFDSGAHLEVTLHGARGRLLSFGDIRRALTNRYIADVDPIELRNDYQLSDVKYRHRDLAVVMTREFFLCFGADFSADVIFDIQSEIYR